VEASTDSSNFAPKPPQRAQLLCDCRVPQRLRRVDPELVEQAPRTLGPEPGQGCDREQPGGEARPQLDRGRDLAGLDQVR